MRVSASGLHRLKHCQWFARDEVPWAESVSGPAADFGTAVHGIVEARIRHPFVAPQDMAVPIPMGVDRARAERTAEEYLYWLSANHRGRRWTSEIAMAYDVATARARIIGVGIGREYGPISNTEIAMTADLATEDGGAEIRDIKTGRRENVDPAESNAQMLTLALAWRSITNADAVRIGLDFVSSFGVSPDERTLDAFDLDVWGEDLRELVEKIEMSKPQPGNHCKYCPAAGACPAARGAIEQVSPSVDDVERRRLPIVTHASAIESMEHARHQYLLLRAAKAAINQAWEALQVYANQHGGIDLGDGRTYVQRETTRETIDLGDRAAIEALRLELGDAFDLAVEASTSKAAIKEAARAIAPKTGEKLAQIERRVLARLREVGAVKTSKSQTWTEAEAMKALTEESAA
jgi:hypothetical protein